MIIISSFDIVLFSIYLMIYLLYGHIVITGLEENSFIFDRFIKWKSEVLLLSIFIWPIFFIEFVCSIYEPTRSIKNDNMSKEQHLKS